MKVIMINEPSRPTREVSDSYGLRLIEQGKAVYAPADKAEPAPAKGKKKE